MDPSTLEPLLEDLVGTWDDIVDPGRRYPDGQISSRTYVWWEMPGGSEGLRPICEILEKKGVRYRIDDYGGVEWYPSEFIYLPATGTTYVRIKLGGAPVATWDEILSLNKRQMSDSQKWRSLLAHFEDDPKGWL